MDLKNKFKSFVQKGSSHTSFPKSLSHGSISPSLREKQLPSKSFTFNHSITEIQEEHVKLYSKYKIEKDIRSAQRNSVRDPEVEKDVLSSIEPEFFQYRDPAECEDFVANKLPEQLDLDFIISEKNRLKKQLAIVSRKVTDLMTKHQSAYFSELQRVIRLQHTVNDCINTCANARSCLRSSQHNLTVRGLQIVADSERRKNLTQFVTHVTEHSSRLQQQLTADQSQGNEADETENTERYETPESTSPVKEMSPIRHTMFSRTTNEITVSIPELD